jgi:hypothetical protein
LIGGAPAAQAQGSSTGGSTSGGSSAGSQAQAGQAPFPARVDDYADCSIQGEGWTPERNRQLSDAFNSNLWSGDGGVQDQISEFLDHLECSRIVPTSPVPAPRHATRHQAIDVSRKKFNELLVPDAYLSVLFLDETLAVPTLSRVIVHWDGERWRCRKANDSDSDSPEVYSARIGAYKFYDVRLLLPGIFAVSQYNASPSPNTLVTQVPSVLSQAAGKVAVPGASAAAAAPTGASITLNKNFLEGFNEISCPSGNCGPPPRPELPVTNECGTPPAPAPTPSATSSFLVRRVTVARSFKRRFPFKVPSVTPTVSITDQLAFSSALESHMIEAQDDRVKELDASLARRNLLPSGGTPLADIEKRLFVAYVRCRMTVTVDVTTDAASYAPDQKPIVIARVRYPAATASLSRLLQVHLTITGPDRDHDGAQPVDRPVPLLSSGPGSSVCVALDAFKIKAQPGQYSVKAEVIETELDGTKASLPQVAASKPAGGQPVAPGRLPVTSANTVFTIARATGGVTGTLGIDKNPAPSVALGTPLQLTYSVSGATKGQLTILDTASGSKLSTQQLDLAHSTSTVVDTGAIGVGDRLAVLSADASGKQDRITLARFAFTVTERTPSLASATPPTGPACLTVDDLTAAQLVGSQAITSGFSSVFSTYSGLLTLAGPTPPSPVSTQYTLGPLTKWAFSLGIGHLTGTFAHDPAKPLADPATWVTLDYHPWKYDETRYSPTLAERFRLFGGLALTPNFGFVAGAGVGIVRGLSLEGGAGVVLANVVNGPNPQPNCTPMVSNGFMCPSSPTGRLAVGIVFVGLGYSFQ